MRGKKKYRECLLPPVATCSFSAESWSGLEYVLWERSLEWRVKGKNSIKKVYYSYGSLCRRLKAWKEEVKKWGPVLQKPGAKVRLQDGLEVEVNEVARVARVWDSPQQAAVDLGRGDLMERLKEARVGDRIEVAPNKWIEVRVADLSGYLALACDVLSLAISDYREAKRAKAHNTVRSLERFFRGQGFVFWCEAAGLDPEVVRERILS